MPALVPDSRKPRNGFFARATTKLVNGGNRQPLLYPSRSIHSPHSGTMLDFGDGTNAATNRKRGEDPLAAGAHAIAPNPAGALGSGSILDRAGGPGNEPGPQLTC